MRQLDAMKLAIVITMRTVLFANTRWIIFVNVCLDIEAMAFANAIWQVC